MSGQNVTVERVRTRSGRIFCRIYRGGRLVIDFEPSGAPDDGQLRAMAVGNLMWMDQLKGEDDPKREVRAL